MFTVKYTKQRRRRNVFALVQAVNSDHILKFGDCQVRVLGTNTTLAERTMFFNPK